ncbi:MAG: nucleotide exchange factor GrpE [Ornithinibacter sp.]
MTDPGMPHEEFAFEEAAAMAGSDSAGDDAINTESVNDGEEVAPAPAGATSAGATSAGATTAGASGPGDVDPSGGAEEGAAAEGSDPAGGPAHPDTMLAAERLSDLQRLQAEYVNYKRRVDRDRALVQERAVHDVLESVLPVLDDIQAAREHGDLVGPFAAIADKLEGTLGKYGLARFGAKGEEFDPMHHEALMHTAWPSEDAELPTGASATTVVLVLQPGYRAGEKVLRPARVSVADPV